MRALRTLAARITRLASLPMKGWAAALTIVAAMKASVTSPNESVRRKLTPLGTRQATLAQNQRHRQCLACCLEPFWCGPRDFGDRCVARRFAEFRCKVASDLPVHLIAKRASFFHRASSLIRP